MKNRKPLYWRLCCAAVIILTAVSVSPFILPVGEYRPMLLGIPYTLWTTILIAIAIVMANIIGAFVHPGQDPAPLDDDGDEGQ